MVWPVPRPWSQSPLWAQKTLEIKGFLGLERPFLDLVSQTPRPRVGADPFVLRKKKAHKHKSFWPVTVRWGGEVSRSGVQWSEIYVLSSEPKVPSGYLTGKTGDLCDQKESYVLKFMCLLCSLQIVRISAVAFGVPFFGPCLLSPKILCSGTYTKLRYPISLQTQINQPVHLFLRSNLAPFALCTVGTDPQNKPRIRKKCLIAKISACNPRSDLENIRVLTSLEIARISAMAAAILTAPQKNRTIVWGLKLGDLSDTARLSQRYPAIAPYGVFGVSTWPIGCDTIAPLERCKVEVRYPPTKGVSQRYLHDTTWKQGKWVQYPPLRCYLEKVLRDGWGYLALGR